MIKDEHKPSGEFQWPLLRHHLTAHCTTAVCQLHLPSSPGCHVCTDKSFILQTEQDDRGSYNELSCHQMMINGGCYRSALNNLLPSPPGRFQLDASCTFPMNTSPPQNTTDRCERGLEERSKKCEKKRMTRIKI